MKVGYQKTRITETLFATTPAAFIFFVIALLFFGISNGFNASIIFPALAIIVVGSVANILINRIVFVQKPITFLEQFGNDVEISLARMGFMRITRGGPITWYERRPPMNIFSGPVLIIQQGSTLRIQGPFAFLRAMAQDIPALLEPEELR